MFPFGLLSFLLTVLVVTSSSSSNISKIQASPQTFGLILTYYINYGLSARRTSALMQDIHGLKISYQTILNYTSILQAHLKPFIDHSPYQLSNQFCGDEIYIKVKGKWHYLVVFFDTANKIILSSPISMHRNCSHQSNQRCLNQV